MTSTSRSVAMSLFGAVLFGTAGTAAALGPDGADPSVLGFMRLFLGAIALLVAVPFFGGSLRRLVILIRRPGVWVMAVCAGAYQPLFFGATARTGVALSTLVAVSFTPVVAGFVGWAVFRERILDDDGRRCINTEQLSRCEERIGCGLATVVHLGHNENLRASMANSD